MPGPWEEMEGRREYLRRTAENTSRSAYAFARYKTAGWGEFVFDRPHDFGLSFLERPYVSFGFAVLEDNIDYDDQDDLVDTRFPRAWGGVHAWVRNSQGLYVGAHCFVVVETRSYYIPTSKVEPKYDLEHSYTFYGLATKYLPAYEAELDI